MKLETYLQRMDSRYNPEQRLVCEPAGGPGYHTRVPAGTPAHSTRSAMDYALALLQSGEPARAERASDIIDRIVSLQVTDSTVLHYGIWGWFMEEPPTQMNPADWNWADFIGARLAQALRMHEQQLRPATAAGARQALHHAAMAIFRRNMVPSYTNIAIMGGVVSAAAGELLGLPFLVEFARVRLGNVLRLVDEAGGFTEFNSPAYTRVGIEETERALLLVQDPKIREQAERIRVLEWQAFAEHYHPATGQIAGPCSRAYTDWLTPTLCCYFRKTIGVGIPYRALGLSDQQLEEMAEYLVVPPIACPPELVSRFRCLPAEPHLVTSRFGANRFGEIRGTTWFTRDACLGSVNRDICWHQRRALLGYWQTSLDPAVCLRARFLKDGRDFGAVYIHVTQQGPRLLASFNLAYAVGDFHPIFDRSPDETFTASDLRMQISLAGQGVEGVSLGDGRYALRAGNRQAIIHTPLAPCTLGQTPIQWDLDSAGSDLVAVDAVLHHGEAMRLDCRNTPLRLAFGLELLPIGEQIASDRPVPSQTADAQLGWTWAGLSVQSPAKPVEFAW